MYWIKSYRTIQSELKGFVAIGSVVPKSGQSFASSLPFPQKLILPILLSLFGTKPPKKSLEAELCNDLTPEATSRIVDEFTPEAKALYTKKKLFELPNTKRLYIKLTNDKSISTDLQSEMSILDLSLFVCYNGHSRSRIWLMIVSETFSNPETSVGHGWQPFTNHKLYALLACVVTCFFQSYHNLQVHRFPVLR